MSTVLTAPARLTAKAVATVKAAALQTVQRLVDDLKAAHVESFTVSVLKGSPGRPNFLSVTLYLVPGVTQDEARDTPLAEALKAVGLSPSFSFKETADAVFRSVRIFYPLASRSRVAR